jgi:predicted transcriptional regulator
MRRSKLETYVDILKVLAKNGPLKLTHIMCKANVNGGLLKDYLGFLIKQGLVEEQAIKKKNSIFSVTKHGLVVLQQLRELSQALPILEEARR